MCEPDAPFDATDFAKLADAAIAQVRSRGKLPIVVGGSGLWLRALLRGLVQLPKVDPALRARLDAEAQTLGVPALHERLKSVDPIAAADIHPNDQVRVVRALEVFEQTGTPLGALRKAHALGAPRYRALRIVLDLTPEELTRRIDAAHRANACAADSSRKSRRFSTRYDRKRARARLCGLSRGG